MDYDHIHNYLSKNQVDIKIRMAADCCVCIKFCWDCKPDKMYFEKPTMDEAFMELLNYLKEGL